MTNSLRDALRQSGLEAARTRPDQDKRKDKRKRKDKNKAGQAAQRKPREDADMDLARAYKLRARSEAREREQARREAERKKREKKERRRRLNALLDGKALNREDTDQLRHYEFHGKIRHMHVTSEQLRDLNVGRLGIVQRGGRFLLVDADLVRQAADIEPGCVALLVDPNASQDGADDGVPDDLSW